MIAMRRQQRVIAFNRDFLNIVRSATGGNAWAPVSIMAHEIGHHLSGHTITPGGSQPDPMRTSVDSMANRGGRSGGGGFRGGFGGGGGGGRGGRGGYGR